MKEDTSRSVSDSLEVNRRLLSHMPYLLQDLWALGSSVDKLLELITNLKLGNNNIHVLDLGCGKGAVSIQIAEKFGFNVLGVDAMKEFISSAREKSAAFNVADKCRFVEGDILEFTKRSRDFDLVILASLGGIFGSNEKTIEVLRSQVKSDGYILIDDGYFKEGKKFNRKGYEHYQSYNDTVMELTKYGDEIIDTISTQDESVEINNFYTKSLKSRLEELSDLHPELKNDFQDYYKKQIDECHFIENEIEGIIWLIRKK